MQKGLLTEEEKPNQNNNNNNNNSSANNNIKLDNKLTKHPQIIVPSFSNDNNNSHQSQRSGIRSNYEDSSPVNYKKCKDIFLGAMNDMNR